MSAEKSTIANGNSAEKFPETPNINGDRHESKRLLVMTENGLEVATFFRVINMLGDTTKVLDQGWLGDRGEVKPIAWFDPAVEPECIYAIVREISELKKMVHNIQVDLKQNYKKKRWNDLSWAKNE